MKNFKIICLFLNFWYPLQEDIFLEKTSFLGNNMLVSIVVGRILYMGSILNMMDPIMFFPNWIVPNYKKKS